MKSKLLILSFLLLASCGGQQIPKDIVILYTNDTHCGYDDHLGFASVAAMKKKSIAEGYPTLLVDCGDHLQGSSYGMLSSGECSIEIMNQVGYDLATIGNHEFDYGIDRLMELVKKANFPYTCANFYKLSEDIPMFSPYSIQTVGDKKIGFIGIVTPTTLSESTPKYFQNEAGEYIYGFKEGDDGENLYACVQEAVDEIKSKGADYVIALSHLGVAESTAPYQSTDVIKNTSGIDVFLDGHSHTVIESEYHENKEGAKVLLTQTGTKIETIGKLTIDVAGKIKAELVKTCDDRDSDVAGKIAAVKQRYDSMLSEVIAHTDSPLKIRDEDGNRIVRKSETNLGDLCADAFREALDSDIAVVNGGAIRDDLPAGEITLNDILVIAPFGNTMAKVSLTGQEIVDMLEYSVYMSPNEFGGFLQVSNLTFSYDASIQTCVTVDSLGRFQSIPGGAQRRVKEVKIGGQPIDLTKDYSVGGADYILCGGGNGYPSFESKRLPLADILDWQVLKEFFETREDLSQYESLHGQSRIIAL